MLIPIWKEREKYSIHWFTGSLVHWPSSCNSPNWTRPMSEASPGSPMCGTGVQVLWSSSTVFPDTYAGSWIRTRITRTQISSHMGHWCHSWWLTLWYHNASPGSHSLNSLTQEGQAWNIKKSREMSLKQWVKIKSHLLWRYKKARQRHRMKDALKKGREWERRSNVTT